MCSLKLITNVHSDVLHPSRANCSKEEIREKLAELYRTSKEQISVFGFRTQYGGGKSTGFGLIYDSVEAMKKFEPTYRLIRVGQATKAERASRQQSEWIVTERDSLLPLRLLRWLLDSFYRFE